MTELSCPKCGALNASKASYCNLCQASFATKITPEAVTSGYAAANRMTDMENLQRRTTADASASAVSEYMNQVYMWMTVGLCLTAFIAWRTASSEAALHFIFGNPLVFYGLLIAQLGVVVALSAAVNRLSATTVTAMFLLYSMLTGVTLSSIFAVYTTGSISNAFFITAGTFGVMSVYGKVTKRDLTEMGSFLIMGLFGLIIAMVVNMFLRNPMMDFIISGCGVLIFTGLIAYDTQKLLKIGTSIPLGDAAALRRGAIMGALTLYLDFINLFLHILRLLGKRR